jgi:DNA-binding transcriptional LysR family regulator
LVAGGIGVSFAITSVEKIKPDSVVLREVDDPRVTAELSAIWRGDNKVPAIQKLIEIVRQHLLASRDIEIRPGRGREETIGSL